MKSGAAYYMSTFQFTTSRMVQGVLKHSETMLPFVFNITNREIEHNQTVIDRLFSVSQSQGYEYNPSADLYDTELIADMRYDFAAEVKAERTNRQEELRRQAESERIHSEAQTKEYYRSRMDIIKARIKEREDILEFVFNDEKQRRSLENIIRLDSLGSFKTFSISSKGTDFVPSLYVPGPQNKSMYPMGIVESQ